MQRSKMISLDSAIFIEGKKRWQMEIGEKAKKNGGKKIDSSQPMALCLSSFFIS
jgi:hypothetical protein